MMAFSDELKKLRKRDGLSQAELADKIGVSRSTISMYENGQREPDFETLEYLADVFNVPMSMLINGNSPATNCDDGASTIALYYGLSASDRAVVDALIEHLAKADK